MTLKQLSYLAGPGVVSMRACEAMATGPDRPSTAVVDRGKKQQAMDSAGGVIEQQVRQDRKSLQRGSQRAESGNDNGEGEIPPNHPGGCKCRACVGQRADDVAKAAHQKLKDAIAHFKKSRKKKATDSKRKVAGAMTRRAGVDAAARTRPTPAFSPRSFVEVKRRGFNLGQSQDEINRANDEAIRRMGARQRGEDIEPSASAELGEYSPAELQSKDPDISFRAQTQAEGRKQREAYLTVGPTAKIQYPSAYEDIQNFEATGKKLQGQDAAAGTDWATRRFELENELQRKHAERA